MRSNLDDLPQFRASVDYVPGRFAFEAAGTGLLKKLVGPLYGDAPEVGIRELIQNAVDAVNERRARAGGPPTDGPDAEIRVLIEGSAERGGTVTVEDRGVGMTEEVIRSYFLRVVASYRESDAWRKAFATGGTPTVIRSGRFGVGALAAFLLGERVELCTRAVDAPADRAMTFAAAIEDETIEVRRTSREFPGTTITVRIDGPTFARLAEVGGVEWDWYRWPTPRIERAINGRVLEPLTRLPGPGAELDHEWHRVNVTGYDEVLWTFGRVPVLVCNGLNVGNKGSSLSYHRRMNWEGESRVTYVDTPVGVPYVSVIDRAARLPLDLQRYGLVQHRYPFADDLLADVTRDFIAFCLTFAPDSPPWEGTAGAFQRPPKYPGWKTNHPAAFYLDGWFYTQEGRA